MLIVEIAIGVALGIFIANYFKVNLMRIKNDIQKVVYKLLAYAIGLVFLALTSTTFLNYLSLNRAMKNISVRLTLH